MKQTLLIFILMLLCPLLHKQAGTLACAEGTNKTRVRKDSLITNNLQTTDQLEYHKMSHSAYPVQMKVIGKAMRVDSPERQILPVYSENGTFYLIMRLNKGTNWLNGLPIGKYFITHRIVEIK